MRQNGFQQNVDENSRKFREILQYWVTINKISFTIIQLCNFALSLSHYSKYFGNILDSVELLKFQSNNVKVMLKDKKSQYRGREY